ncbi:MAG: hypothetical protein Q7W44_11015 [Coriobacteriia bacterium]|nr:hypothetical protein [Coriobacteriia bacterium]
MTLATLRESYLAWIRHSSALLLLPLALTAAVQWASRAPWWREGPPPSGSARYLFLSVAVAALVVGRNVRTRDTAARPLEVASLRSVSWQMLTYALAPVVIGAALAFMTRELLDFYSLLLVTLVGLALLFPRFDQWAEWSTCPDASAGEI